MIYDEQDAFDDAMRAEAECEAIERAANREINYYEWECRSLHATLATTIADRDAYERQRDMARMQYGKEAERRSELEGEVATLRAALASATRERDEAVALAKFGALVLYEWWSDGVCGDVDGGTAQEYAEEAGLWHQVDGHAEGVECEVCGNDGPCGELTEAGAAALARIAGEGKKP